MRHVRPVRLVLTASLTAAAVAIALHPSSAPAPAARTTLPTAPTDTLVTTAEPADPTLPVLPATPNARLAIERTVLPGAHGDEEIPDAAIAAYQRAASVAAKVDKTCGITWTLLAAIGGIESDHGQHGGSVLGEDGVSTPLIRGVALDGKGPVAKVADTDAGLVDGDEKWDRAVGPMQFLPATWATVGVDADGDGERSADDLDDAALGAAVYLCAVPGTLSERAGLEAALLRYNPSREYARRVIALERDYRTGHYALPDLAPAPPSVLEAGGLPQTLASEPGGDQHGDQHGGQGGGQRGDQKPGQKPGDKPGHQDQEPSQPGQQGPGDKDKQGDIKDWPDQHPHPQPPKSPQPEPEPEPEPVTETVTGVLAQGGTAAAPVWSLEGTVLDLGDAAYLAAPALGDFDGDATVETNAEELAGLVGAEVTLTVRRTTDDAAPVVLAIGGTTYLAD